MIEPGHEFAFETVTVDDAGEIARCERRTARRFLEDLGGSVVLEMVEIPAGAFLMGSPEGQGYDDEHPQHKVALPSFFLGRYPVTQEQWDRLMERRPPYRFHGARRPVERASWVEAQEFCRRLAERTGRAYCLPGEAQWEYACRAGTTTPFSCGPTITTALANYCGEHTYRREPKGLYRHETTTVGYFPPNAFGLHDMHGGLWEWCADPWHPDYGGAPADGSVWEEGGDSERRVVRGGSWHEPPAICRCAIRLAFGIEEGDDLVGFRVAIVPERPL